jgi:hypothetical protein
MAAPIQAGSSKTNPRLGKSAGPLCLRRLRAIAGVWLFYALIHIWNVQPVTLGFAQRGRFFLSLFGL